VGLPSVFRKLKNETLDKSKTDLLLAGFIAGRHANQKMASALAKAKRSGATDQKLANDIAKWYLRHFRRKTLQSTDSLTREKAKLYIGIDESNAEEHASFRDVEIPKYFQKKLAEWNTERELRDRDAIDLLARIRLIRNRIFASRTFPSFLRAIIFERDNYTCQVCLRSRDVLKAAGLHLECDHIVAWEDDGKTTYDNGQTICSDCNKAKHHSKHYLGLIMHLNRPTS